MKVRGKGSSGDVAATGAKRVVSRARSAAFEILRRVEDDGAFASVLLAAEDDDMRPDDRGLCYELVMGVLRWQLWLDALIDHFAERSSESLDKPVRRALRMGLYELRFLSRIPASATVNEAVNLTYFARLRSASGLVNAVLRRATREKNYDPVEEIVDPVLRLSVATSHPRWLIDRWINALGVREAEEFARSNNQPPPLAFRVVNGNDVELVLKTLSDAGGIVSPSRISPDAWRVDDAGATVREMAAQGCLYLQDEASQLVAHVVEARKGNSVLDVCAAPGGKTTQIAGLAPNAKVIVAGDIYDHRLRTVRHTSVRTGAGNITLVLHDATIALPFRDQTFSRVLVDAPCSGTGTLRRNPEIKWRISAQDILDMGMRQRLILANAAKVVQTGGRLIYSTCSIEPDENEAVVTSFLQNNNDFIQVTVKTDSTLVREDGSLRTWPHKEGTDGFFIAAFERRG